LTAVDIISEQSLKAVFRSDSAANDRTTNAQFINTGLRYKLPENIDPPELLSVAWLRHDILVAETRPYKLVTISSYVRGWGASGVMRR
jgi:hypothetical protein